MAQRKHCREIYVNVNDSSLSLFLQGGTEKYLFRRYRKIPVALKGLDLCCTCSKLTIRITSCVTSSWSFYSKLPANFELNIPCIGVLVLFITLNMDFDNQCTTVFNIIENQTNHLLYNGIKLNFHRVEVYMSKAGIINIKKLF